MLVEAGGSLRVLSACPALLMPPIEGEAPSWWWAGVTEVITGSAPFLLVEPVALLLARTGCVQVLVALVMSMPLHNGMGGSHPVLSMAPLVLFVDAASSYSVLSPSSLVAPSTGAMFTCSVLPSALLVLPAVGLAVSRPAPLALLSTDVVGLSSVLPASLFIGVVASRSTPSSSPSISVAGPSSEPVGGAGPAIQKVLGAGVQAGHSQVRIPMRGDWQRALLDTLVAITAFRAQLLAMAGAR